MTAKAHGLEDECQALLDASGLTEAEITLPTIGKPLTPPSVIVDTFNENWPTKSTGVSSFERALLEGGGDDDAGPVTNGHDENDLLADGTEDDADGLGAEEEEDAAGWDMGDDVAAEADEEFVEVESAETGAGSSEAEVWTRNSPLAADHIAGGSYESAMNLLNRQVGAVNFEPLKPRFEEIYLASRTYLAANPGLPSIVSHVRRTLEDTESRKLLPVMPQAIATILGDQNNKLVAARKLMTSNKLEEGIVAFRELIHLLLINVAESVAEEEEVSDVLLKHGLVADT